MEIQELISIALKAGFYKAEVIDTDKICIDLGFRKYCEENLCGNYGRNYSCPPDCGTAYDMKGQIHRYENALVLQSRWEIDDVSNRENLRSVRLMHNNAMLRIVRQLKNEGYEGVMAGASECLLCDTCQKIKGGECLHPNERYSCLSAYCVNVSSLAKTCSMDYTYKDGVLYFFGMYLFNIE